jgi:hypothetical protein
VSPMSVSVPQSLRVWVPVFLVRYGLLKIRLEYQHHSCQKQNRTYIFVISSNTYSREIYCAFSIRKRETFFAFNICHGIFIGTGCTHDSPPKRHDTAGVWPHRALCLGGRGRPAIKMYQPACPYLYAPQDGEVMITNESNALDRSNNMPAIRTAEFSGGNSPIQHRVEWGRPRFVTAEEFVGGAKFEQGLSSTPHLPSKPDSSGK